MRERGRTQVKLSKADLWLVRNPQGLVLALSRGDGKKSGSPKGGFGLPIQDFKQNRQFLQSKLLQLQHSAFLSCQNCGLRFRHILGQLAFELGGQELAAQVIGRMPYLGEEIAVSILVKNQCPFLSGLTGLS